MLKKRYLTGKAIAGITLGLCCVGLPAQQDFQRDIALAKELNAINLQDYAQKLIDSLLAKNQDVPELLAQKAENFVVQGKMDEAKAIIATLPKNSPAYYQAQAGIGIYFVQRRKFAEGLPMLMEVKDYAVKNNLVSAYQLPLQWLLTALQDQGKAAEAQELLAILAALGQEEPETEAQKKEQQREMQLAQARYGLSCIENMKEQQKTRYDALMAEFNDKWKAAYMTPANRKDLDSLKKQRDNATANYYKSIRGGNAKAAETHRTIYENAYKNIAKKIGMSEANALELASLQKVVSLQKERYNLIIQGRSKLNPQQVAFLQITDPNDWQDVIFKILNEMEEVQWGGHDSCFFMAVANIMQAYYHLGLYEQALKVYRKNAKDFQLCDAEYKKNPALAIENSPTSDARIWEGMCALALAKQKELSTKADDKKLAEKYYRQAFVAFGQLLINYPKHRDGAKNYPIFLEIVEKLKALNPQLAGKLDAQVARVPKPERKVSATQEIENLIAPLPAEEFKKGSQIASENQQKDRTSTPSTDADWEKCQVHFKVVVSELAPLLSEKRLSNGLPKLLNHLMIAYGYLGDELNVRALAEMSEFMYRDDDLIHHGLVVAANALWIRAERLEKAQKYEEARFLQDKTMILYDIFLRIAPSHPYAPIVAMRLASVEFLRADQLGKILNAEKDTEIRERLRKERLAGFDRAIARFEFIFNNFANKTEFLDRAYELAVEAYRLTKRYEKAAIMGERFCNSGTKDINRLLKGKMDVAANLYNHVLELQEATADLQKRVDAIVEPTAPTAPEDKEDVEAMKAYENALKEYEAAKLNYQALLESKKKIEDQIAQNKQKIQSLSLRALEHIKELREWLSEKGMFEQYARTPRGAEVNLRADMITPWLYTAIGDNEKSVQEYENFVNKHPDHEQVPPYLMQAGVLCLDFDTTKATYFFNKLATEHKDKPEGKQVVYFLAMTLYNRDRMAEALTEFEKIFRNDAQGSELRKKLTCNEYRWISENLLKCKNPQFAGRAAIIALHASEELIKLISAPKITLTDWVSPKKAAELESNQEQFLKFISNMKELFLMNSANAARIIGKAYLDTQKIEKDPTRAAALGQEATKYYQRAISFYDKLVPENMRMKSVSMYYYEVLFNRAEIKLLLKDFAGAEKDLIAASRRANGPLAGYYQKAQTRLGKLYMEQAVATGNNTFYNKAHGQFMIIAALPFPEPDPEAEAAAPKKDEKEMTAEEKFRLQVAQDGADALEEAVFLSAKTAALLNDQAVATKMAQKYLKYYPEGKFIGEAKALAR